MGDCITLDDGRTLVRSSIGVAGVLSLVAKHLPDGHERFRKWLLDVSDRPSGFASIDLRGLPELERQAFHTGVHTAYAQTIGIGLVLRQLKILGSRFHIHSVSIVWIRSGNPKIRA
jgi:hypothetical protein